MKVGLMTFHSAHNYGSVLQAYATQTFIEKYGVECEIINYRLTNQREYYNNLYSFKFGLKKGLQKLFRLKSHFKRKERSNKFEKFIQDNLHLTAKEYSSYESMQKEKWDYDVIMSGSDQVWNINSKAEFMFEPKENILPYFLDFGPENIVRASFSSSFGTMTEQQIKSYLNFLNKFDYLSVREPKSADLLSRLLTKEVISLLDPTLLIDKSDWHKLSVKPKIENYLLIYSLSGMKNIRDYLMNTIHLRDFSFDSIIVIAPLAKVVVPAIGKRVVVVENCGPEEFLGWVENASVIITDSFHGTAFSINFGKDFFVVGQKEDSRACQLLKKLGIHNRVNEDFGKMRSSFYDASKVLNQERKKAAAYVHSISGEVI